METYTRRILLISIILIFLIFASYNIGVSVVHHKYNQASEVNTDIQKAIELSDNPEVIDILTTVNEEILFINAFCFDQGAIE